MKGKLVIAGAVAAALTVPMVAQAGDGDKATGGGQILVGAKGAGDTLAFNAQDTGGTARGRVTYQDRDNGTGKGQTTYHGTVTCIEAVGNVARIGGTWRDGGTFQLYVEDNGEPNQGNDIATLLEGSGCDFDEPDDEDKTGLARGNSQVRDGEGASDSKRPMLTYKKALRLAGLR